MAGRTGNILVVDDDESIRRVIGLVLERLGHRTAFAESGVEALEIAGSSRVDVALVDIKLPDMDGTELLLPLTGLQPDASFIMITGFVSTDSLLKALNSGVSAYIQKPVNMDEILMRIAEALDRQHLRRENRRLYQAAQAEIAQRMMVQSELEAHTLRLERTNRDLEDFAYICSHHLQEPLRKIQTFSDRASQVYQEVACEVGHDCIERLQKNARHLRSLIRDIHRYSVLAGRCGNPERTEISEVIALVLTEYAEEITKLQASVDVGPVPAVSADRQQMFILFSSLVDNSLKFRGPEPPVVKISADETIGWCTISVSDNGIGFEEKYLDRMFTPFQRLHSGDSFEGTGMGLAICRKIAELHGGSLTATGSPGRGATFCVTLPMEIPGFEEFTDESETEFPHSDRG